MVFHCTLQGYLVHSKISLRWSVFYKLFIPIPYSIFIIVAPKAPSIFIVIGFDTLSLDQGFTDSVIDSELVNEQWDYFS